MNVPFKLRELINLKLEQRNITKATLVKMLKGQVSSTVIYTILNSNSRYEHYPYFQTVLPILKVLDIKVKDFFNDK